MSRITRYLWNKAGRERIPLTGTFELLPTCNLSCKMCYVRKSWKEVQEAGGLLPAEYWLRIADQAAQEGLLYLLLTGGEPFLHGEFKAIMSGMLERGIQVSINTNGTLIDEEMAMWLNEHRPIRINITLYGASEESYQKLCGDGNAYRKVQKAVSLLKQYNLPVKFNTSLTKYNVNDLEAMMDYAKSVNSPIEVATYMFPPIRRDKSMVGNNDRLSSEEAGFMRVKADYLQGDKEWFYSKTKKYRYFQPLSKEQLDLAASGEPKEIGCRAGRCAFWIDWQGNIGNCGMYAATGLKLKEKSFKEAWKEVVNNTDQVRYSAVCTNCPNYSLCHSCVAMVHNECGTINGRPEYICKMTAAASWYYKKYAELMELGKNPLDYNMDDLN